MHTKIVSTPCASRNEIDQNVLNAANAVTQGNIIAAAQFLIQSGVEGNYAAKELLAKLGYFLCMSNTCTMPWELHRDSVKIKYKAPEDQSWFHWMLGNIYLEASITLGYDKALPLFDRVVSRDVWMPFFGLSDPNRISSLPINYNTDSSRTLWFSRFLERTPLEYVFPTRQRIDFSNPSKIPDTAYTEAKEQILNNPPHKRAPTEGNAESLMKEAGLLIRHEQAYGIRSVGKLYQAALINPDYTGNLGLAAVDRRETKGFNLDFEAGTSRTDRPLPCNRRHAKYYVRMTAIRLLQSLDPTHPRIEEGIDRLIKDKALEVFSWMFFGDFE